MKVAQEEPERWGKTSSKSVPNKSAPKTTSVQFDLFPAIDLYQGRCVRLFQGDYGMRTEYSANPVEVAREFADAGVRWLHVVDLDAAKTGGTENQQVIQAIAAVCETHGVRVQVGGGVRSAQRIDALLALGVTRCIIGTAITDTEWMRTMVKEFGGDKLVAGLDGRDGRLAVKGWVEQTNVSLVELAQTLADVGIKSALVTDVARDGTLSGPNLQLALDVQEQSGLQVLASGGVSSMEDIRAAKERGLAGAIVGRALYDGRIDLHSAFTLLEEMESC